jgi:hypothetical protein
MNPAVCKKRSPAPVGQAGSLRPIVNRPAVKPK